MHERRYGEEKAKENVAAEDDFFDDRVFGMGQECLDAKIEERHSNIRATGVAGRAKQFIPFAALKGFSELIDEAARAHDNIDQHSYDEGDVL